MTVSVCDSRNERRGADVLRWSLYAIREADAAETVDLVPDVDRRLMRAIIWVFNTSGDKAVQCIADEG